MWPVLPCWTVQAHLRHQEMSTPLISSRVHPPSPPLNAPSPQAHREDKDKDKDNATPMPE